MKTFNWLKQILLPLIALILIGICFFFYGMIGEHFENKKIVKNGVEIEAEVVSYNSDLRINNNLYYYLNYKFEYNGEIHSGRTSTNYTRSTASSTKTLTIKYYNGKSIEANYTKPKAFTMTIIAATLLSFIAVALICPAIVDLSHIIQAKHLLRSGKIANAHFVSGRVNMYVNGKATYFKIVLEYLNDNNEKQESTSLGYCNYEQLLYLKSKKSFEVRYNNKHCIISEPIEKHPDLSNVDVSFTITNEKVLKKLQKNISNYKCEHCLHIVKPNSDGSCPNCGKIIQQYLNKNDD